MLSLIRNLFRMATLPLVISALLVVSTSRSTAWSQEDAEFARRVSEIVEKGISEGKLPGAVIVVADHDHVIYQEVFGDRQVEPVRYPMTFDTVFDLASLTKPVATATSVMRLVQLGKVDIAEPVSKYLPEFAGHGKESITVSDLLLHVGGLIPDNALADYDQGSENAWERICALKMVSPRGERFAYTDVGFIVLGKLVERVSGKPLHQFAADEIFAPLGMRETGFLPPQELKERAAPTEKRDGEWMRGDVHDPRAHRLGGVAGHAGLFSTAGDLVRYGQSMLTKGEASNSLLNAEIFGVMATPREVPRGTRTYGWDHRSPYSSNRGESLSDAAFGHGGFTGTVLWIDPEKDRVFVFLSNRLHPDGEGSVNRLAGEIATLIGASIPEPAGH